jgi:hypothetical protein
LAINAWIAAWSNWLAMLLSGLLFCAGLLMLHIAVLAVVGHDLYLPCLLELVVDMLLFFKLFLLGHSERKWFAV